VDLMIAAESFFLSDSGDPAGRAELSYRMAMRFAFCRGLQLFNVGFSSSTVLDCDGVAAVMIGTPY
jgi:hypothetical protein